MTLFDVLLYTSVLLYRLYTRSEHPLFSFKCTSCTVDVFLSWCIYTIQSGLAYFCHISRCWRWKWRSEQCNGTKIKLGTVVHGPDKRLFYGLQIKHDINVESTVDADLKHDAHPSYLTNIAQCKDFHNKQIPHKQKSFNTIKSFHGRLWTSVSRLCAFYFSFMQQIAPSATEEAFIFQINVLKYSKRHGTATHF